MLALPTVTRQGINYRVHEKKIPLALKAGDFLLRDFQYRRLSAEITRGARSPEEKTVRLLRWTHDHIRLAPPELPVIDDHVARIIDRGYGDADQLADVFTTLAAYSGLSAFWQGFRTPDRPGGFILSFVKIKNHWTAWDVAAGKVYPMDLLPGEHFSVPEVLRPTKQMPLPRLMMEVRQRMRRKKPA